MSGNCPFSWVSASAFVWGDAVKLTTATLGHSKSCSIQDWRSRALNRFLRLAAFLGVPNIMKRLLLGADERLVPDLMKSGKWTGTEAYLNTILQNYYLKQSLMPIRDGIDFVHAGILSTFRGLKFSNLSQVCGGSIEIAVITSDRPFRWVRHKRFDEKPVGNGAISSATIAHGSICRNVRAFQAARMVPPTRPTASFGRPA